MAPTDQIYADVSLIQWRGLCNYANVQGICDVEIQAMARALPLRQQLEAATFDKHTNCMKFS